MDGPIVVFGATSGIGARCIEEAASRGLKVRAFARGAGSIQATDLIDPVPGDALRPGDVARALEGARAVIYTLGMKTRPPATSRVSVFSESTEVLLREMSRAGVSRLVAVTGFGAGRSADAMSLPERVAQRAVLGRAYADKGRQERLIMDSTVDWTIVRPVILINGRNSRRVRVLKRPETWRNGLVARAEVAAYLVDAVERDLDIRSDVVISR